MVSVIALAPPMSTGKITRGALRCVMKWEEHGEPILVFDILDIFWNEALKFLSRRLWALPVFFIPATIMALEINIRVLDPETGKSIPDAQVIILETKEKIFTDE